ncbi:3,4-dihydroxy-2-butanone-4-phosphate synthase [Wenzhouxiangella marina]|uniref:3,4-dihydroxy-2-butanone 4-phosphate synthase n=1 Tax=Wenzhouxiangella marina TaxID=1579979 RepID=A0A0K0XY24_9GAMM|nr:3,4-dihydroxy-2-butanone-4-phosphate synthase [Wenzhouxiangella marina]AKS42599.1 3,4-dihydroxy-2-butanone 4-phosphate synthase [Wenzhouxiangella marina]MBB6085619.1 3,4-dihydroxy 2-butanone 4-phosphate synthase/GTP cyclohydrolase II [Wenzhouxiangella marina]
MKFDSIPDILADIRAGKMVVMLDDEDRENEGDLIMAASLTRPEDVNFMARYGRGLICLSLTRERCSQLGLQLMVRDTDRHHQTNFTVSIEAAEGVTTGISAYDRAHTIRTAVAPDARPQDLNQPGHVFPLMAQPGGVLARAGHTEASMDLALLAGLEPAGVLVEILNEDGTMARRPELEAFAAEHGLRMGTVADLIRYRLGTEQNVECVHSQEVGTSHGPFQLKVFRDRINRKLHWALVRGEIHADESFPVRVHVPELLGDVLGLTDPGFGMPLDAALADIDRRGKGLALVLGYDEDDESRLAGLLRSGRSSGADSARDPAAEALRSYGIAAQIIAELGIRRMQVFGAPKRLHALDGFGLEITDYVVPEGEDDPQ